MTADEDSDRLLVLVLAARKQDDLADYVKDMEVELGIGDGVPERVGQVGAAWDRVLAAAARRHGVLQQQQQLSYYDRSGRLAVQRRCVRRADAAGSTREHQQRRIPVRSGRQSRSFSLTTWTSPFLNRLPRMGLV